MIPWNKGKKLSDKHKKNLSLSHMGQIAWNKGRPWSSEMKIKLGNSHKNKGIIHRKPDKSLIYTLRGIAEYRNWKKLVLEEGENRCLWCGGIERVEADHVVSMGIILKQQNIKTIKEALICKELWDTKNGRVLCRKCHKKTTNYAGRSGKIPYLSMVIPLYTLSKELEDMAYRAVCSYRPQVDEIILVEDGGMYSSRLQAMANLYIYNKKNKGFTSTVNQGWKMARGQYVCVVNSDTTLMSGYLVDLCKRDFITSPEIINQHIPFLAGPFWCAPKVITKKYGYLNEAMRTYASDSDYDNRVRSIFQKVPSVKIYHEMMQTVRAAGVEGGTEAARDNAIYNKLKEEGKAS